MNVPIICFRSCSCSCSSSSLTFQNILPIEISHKMLSNHQIARYLCGINVELIISKINTIYRTYTYTYITSCFNKHNLLSRAKEWQLVHIHLYFWRWVCVRDACVLMFARAKEWTERKARAKKKIIIMYAIFEQKITKAKLAKNGKHNIILHLT